jgi:hypothetical protein
MFEVFSAIQLLFQFSFFLCFIAPFVHYVYRYIVHDGRSNSMLLLSCVEISSPCASSFAPLYIQTLFFYFLVELHISMELVDDQPYFGLENTRMMHSRVNYKFTSTSGTRHDMLKQSDQWRAT